VAEFLNLRKSRKYYSATKAKNSIKKLIFGWHDGPFASPLATLLVSSLINVIITAQILLYNNLFSFQENILFRIKNSLEQFCFQFYYALKTTHSITGLSILLARNRLLLNVL